MKRCFKYLLCGLLVQTLLIDLVDTESIGKRIIFPGLGTLPGVGNVLN